MTPWTGSLTGVCTTPVLGTVCTALAGDAGGIATAAFEAMGRIAGQTAKTMFQLVWSAFDDSTIIDLTRPGYIALYNLLFGIAIALMLLMFFLQLATALLRHDPAALGRAVTGLAKSVIGAFLVITLTGLLLTVVDGLCIGIVHATGTTMARLGTRIAALGLALTAVSVASPGATAILTIFLAGLAITATACLWFSLLIRKSLLMVAIVLAPIALAGGVSDATRGWTARWAQLVLALAVSKLVVVVVFLVATVELDAPIAADLKSISDPLTGIVLMFVAAFAPYMAYRFISFIDLHPAHLHEQDAKQALNRPIPLPTGLSPIAARSVLARSTATGSSGGAAIAAGTGAAAGTSAAAAVPVAGAVIVGLGAAKAAPTSGPSVGNASGVAAADTMQGASRASTSPRSPASRPAPRPDRMDGGDR